MFGNLAAIKPTPTGTANRPLLSHFKGLFCPQLNSWSRSLVSQWGESLHVRNFVPGASHLLQHAGLAGEVQVLDLALEHNLTLRGRWWSQTWAGIAASTARFVFFQALKLGHDLRSARGHNQRLRRRLPGRNPATFKKQRCAHRHKHKFTDTNTQI